jgi:hypothetical protein
MACPADDYAGSPVRRPHAPDSEAAVVLTPEGQQWLLTRAAWLASEHDQAGWATGTTRAGQPS